MDIQTVVVLAVSGFVFLSFSLAKMFLATDNRSFLFLTEGTIGVIVACSLFLLSWLGLLERYPGYVHWWFLLVFIAGSMVVGDRLASLPQSRKHIFGLK